MHTYNETLQALVTEERIKNNALKARDLFDIAKRYDPTVATLPVISFHRLYVLRAIQAAANLNGERQQWIAAQTRKYRQRRAGRKGAAARWERERERVAAMAAPAPEPIETTVRETVQGSGREVAVRGLLVSFFRDARNADVLDFYDTVSTYADKIVGVTA